MIFNICCLSIFHQVCISHNPIPLSILFNVMHLSIIFIFNLSYIYFLFFSIFIFFLLPYGNFREIQYNFLWEAWIFSTQGVSAYKFYMDSRIRGLISLTIRETHALREQSHANLTPFLKSPYIFSHAWRAFALCDFGWNFPVEYTFIRLWIIIIIIIIIMLWMMMG